MKQGQTVFVPVLEDPTQSVELPKMQISDGTILHVVAEPVDSTCGKEMSNDLNQTKEKDPFEDFYVTTASLKMLKRKESVDPLKNKFKDDPLRYLFEESRQNVPTQDEKVKFRKFFSHNARMKWQKAVNCPIKPCLKGKGTRTARSLIEHVGVIHYEEDILRKFFHGRHIPSKNLKAWKMACTLCKRSSNSMRNLMSHLTMTHDALSVVMEQEEFVTLLNLIKTASDEVQETKHKRDLSGWNFACPIEDCLAKGETKPFPEFATHYLEVHETEKIELEFEIDFETRTCSECDLQCSKVLLHHITKHDGMIRILGDEGFDKLLRTTDRRLAHGQRPSVERPK